MRQGVPFSRPTTRLQPVHAVTNYCSAYFGDSTLPRKRNGGFECSRISSNCPNLMETFPCGFNIVSSVHVCF